MSGIHNEKFYVGVPEDTYTILTRDAELFEIMHEDDRGVNMNRFLMLLLQGYYKNYKRERNEKIDRIREMIGPWIKAPGKAEEVAEQIMEEIVVKPLPVRKGKNPERMSFKPTTETDQIITEIKEKEKRTYAQYLCRMFMSYSEKPLYERERIIFRDNVEFLEKACKGKKGITLTTRKAPEKVQHVVAYSLVVDADGRNNYLLAQKRNDQGRFEAMTYRLCRIVRPDYDDISDPLDPDVAGYLEKMKKDGPQFSLQGETDICVRLTPAGQKSYRQIYFARPAVLRDRIEMLEDGCALYHFNASPDQVFHFVIRFNAGEAEIMYPAELRERIHEHYRKALKLYEP